MAVLPNEALDIICTSISKENFEIVPIENATGRICAQNIFATLFLPKFNNSAMDGYAVLYENAGEELRILDTIFAGDNNDIELQNNTCVKIMTGAKVPHNATAIIPKEDVEIINETTIQIPQNIKENQHIRFIGEDIKNGELLIAQKDEINFAKITLLVSQGISHIKVYKKPKVVVFASGEELKLHYEKAEDYQIYNSNTPTFIARCNELGCEVNFIGQAHDSIESIKESIENSLDADLIITSGGVSVGDADFTKAAFNELDFETLFDGIIIKPGKPTVFGKINNTFILNLPGNPLASALIFELFGKIIIQNLLGAKDIYHNTISTVIKEETYNKKGRETIIPGFFDGQTFMPSFKRSPGMVSTLSHCNGMIVLHENVEKLKKGKNVQFLPINWTFFSGEKKDYLTYE
jgi:molybdopterin molybdotransferase